MSPFRHFIAAAVIVLGVCSQAFSDAGKIIGVPTALTGNASTYGVDIKNALLFANDELAGGEFKFVFEDDKCNGKDAANIAHKFVDILRLKYVLGFACSSTVLSTAEIYRAGDAVIISPSASAAAISKAGEHVFRTWPSDDGAARTIYGYIAKHQRAVGILSEQTDFAQGILGSVQSLASGSTISVINENFLTENGDFRSLLLRLKHKGSDSLFINSQTEETFYAALKQVRDLRWDVPLYGVYWPGSNALLARAGLLADGIIYADVPAASEIINAEGKELLSRFIEKYEKINSSEMLIVTTIEAFRALSQAISSGQDVKEYLNQKYFVGLFGKWKFDSNGDIEGLNYVVKTITAGLPVNLVPST